jgi:hypothetical protein
MKREKGTDCNFKPLKSFLILLYEAETGIVVFKKDGNLGLCAASRAS